MFMLDTVLRNVTKKPATRNYPFVKKAPFDGMRGRLFIHVDKCIFCRMCQMRCPSQCIYSDPKQAIWSYDPFECVNCGICMEVCPAKCLFMDNLPRTPSPQKFCRHVQGVKRHQAVDRKHRRDRQVVEPAPEAEKIDLLQDIHTPVEKE